MKTITWLHISDWHQGGPDFDRRVVREALLDDIKHRTRISSDLEKLDFIVFSGDLAYSGAKEQYITAKQQLIDPLVRVAGISPGHLFFVPGNHDFDRRRIDFLAGDLLGRFAKPGVLNQALSDEGHRRTFLAPMQEYLEFLKSCDAVPAAARSDYGWSASIEVAGEKVALIGLNSAWMCARNKDTTGEIDDYGQLLLGEHQIVEVLANSSQDAAVLIGILHHPFQWLASRSGIDDRSKSRSRLMEECHFILHGHEHEPAVWAHKSSFGDCITIPAGSAYEKRNPPSTYANGYNYCHVRLTAGDCEVYQRRFDGNRTWIKDLQPNSGENGAFGCTLPKKKGTVVLMSGVSQGVSSGGGTMADDQVFLVTKSDPQSPRWLLADPLNESVGSILLWAYVHEQGKCLRRTGSNRYLFAHAIEASKPYKNVFALAHGLKSFEQSAPKIPSWKVWLADGSGSGITYTYDDKLNAGWHHFCVRWNHDRPRIELWIDAEVVLLREDYLRYWPSKILSRLDVGCWPNRSGEHFSETSFSRVSIEAALVTDERVRSEFARKPPPVTNA